MKESVEGFSSVAHMQPLVFVLPGHSDTPARSFVRVQSCSGSSWRCSDLDRNAAGEAERWRRPRCSDCSAAAAEAACPNRSVFHTISAVFSTALSAALCPNAFFLLVLPPSVRHSSICVEFCAVRLSIITHMATSRCPAQSGCLVPFIVVHPCGCCWY